jgi:hypothetical protein
MPGRLSAITEVTPQLIATATLRLETPGAGFTDSPVMPQISLPRLVRARARC